MNWDELDPDVRAEYEAYVDLEYAYHIACEDDPDLTWPEFVEEQVA